MLFNSIEFVLFFTLVTLLYYSFNLSNRIWLLLIASCYFYLFFKPVYLLILIGTIIVDYFAGILIEKSVGKQKLLCLVLSLIANLGCLAFFKYFDFASENTERILHLFGNTIQLPRMSNFFTNYMLPIGLSFHTFQAMSYTIEVYRGNQKAERDFKVYALYVMFYPQLVAGPIERPQNVLPQFHRFHAYNFENVKAGLLQMMWGFFKKAVIADRLVIFVDEVYNQPEGFNGLTILMATFFFTFQIYCDFSGYSDIALGSAKVMGFDLMKNFDQPYISRSISEFWRRWHISLSTWFRDYLYIPLGGNRVKFYRNCLNIFIVFTASGLWHGAKWTFVIWGSLHGIYLISALIRDKYLLRRPSVEGQASKALDVIFTFCLVMLTWVFFRANTLHDALLILQRISELSFSEGLVSNLNLLEFVFCFILILILILKEHFIPVISSKNTVYFYWTFFGFAIINYLFGIYNQSQFIYFQF